MSASVRCRWAVAFGLALGLAATPAVGPAAGAARGPDPVYRILVKIATTSPSESLWLSEPADLIEGKATVTTRRPGVRASFRGFGAGPLRVEQPATKPRRWARATFVVALTPAGAPALRFESVKGSEGKAVVEIANLNRESPVPIRTVKHLQAEGTVRSFSLPVEGVASRGPVPGTDPAEPIVLAVYYPWYSLADWPSGRIAGYNRNDRPYDSGDPSAIARHIQQAQAAGIDGFISEWHGEGSLTDRNLQAVFDQAPEDFKLAVLFAGSGAGLDTEAEIVSALGYALGTLASRAQYLTFQGQPVLYIWDPQHVLVYRHGPPNPQYRAVWHAILRRLRAQGYAFWAIGLGDDVTRDLSVFDGIGTYVPSDPDQTPSLFRKMELIARAYAAVHGGVRRLWGAGVIPGYDDRQTIRPTHRYLPRENGSVYRSQWAAAINSYSDQALIVTFNEWYETTNIEPNERWGDTYLNITAEETAAFKRSR